MSTPNDIEHGLFQEGLRWFLGIVAAAFLSIAAYFRSQVETLHVRLNREHEERSGLETRVGILETQHSEVLRRLDRIEEKVDTLPDRVRSATYRLP